MSDRDDDGPLGGSHRDDSDVEESGFKHGARSFAPPARKRSLFDLIMRGGKRNDNIVAEERSKVQVPVVRGQDITAEVFPDPARPPAQFDMPEKARRGLSGIGSFFLMVVLPVSGAAIYYGAIASPQYVSEFRYAVTQTSPPTLGAPGASTGGTSAVAGMLGGMGMATIASTQNYIVTDYLTSAQAVADVEKRIKVSKRFDRPGIDWFSRYDSSQPPESLVTYWQKMVTATYDPITGLATAQVRAFSPADAKLIGETLVSLSEGLVNQIDMRSKLDYVHFAENDVARGEKRVKAATGALMDFRIAEHVIDPTVSIVAGNVQDTTAVRSSLLQLKTQIAVLQRQRVGMQSPVMQNLQAQAEATQAQLTRLEQQVSNQRENAKPLSSVMKRYEQLDLERQYAQTFLLSTLAELDQARTAAGEQSLYLTPYVRPVLPGKSTYPNRATSTLIIGLICFAVWLGFVLAFRAFEEYA